MSRAEMTRISERRVVKLMKSRRPASVCPRARYRGSALEWPGSLRSTRGRLKKISSASQKATRCRSQFLSTFPSSQSKPTQSLRTSRDVTRLVYARNIRTPRRPPGAVNSCRRQRLPRRNRHPNGGADGTRGEVDLVDRGARRVRGERHRPSDASRHLDATTGSTATATPRWSSSTTSRSSTTRGGATRRSARSARPSSRDAPNPLRQPSETVHEIGSSPGRHGGDSGRAHGPPGGPLKSGLSRVGVNQRVGST